MQIQFIMGWNGKRRRIIPLLWLIVTAAVAPVVQAAEDPLIIGVFPRLSASETTTRYAPLADDLGNRLGRKVSLITSKDFQSFWQGIEGPRYEIPQDNQYHYIRSAKT